MIHEGGSATHNGHGTMIVVESVVIQRNLGPDRFCGGQAPVTDYRQPNTYAPNPDWPACRALVEQEYHRMLGVKKFIWVPTGVIEDNGTFRGALGTHIQVPRFDGVEIPHAGVYTMFTTNGHPDEYLRFVSPTKVVLAQASPRRDDGRSRADELIGWLEEQNHQRLERVYDILSRERTESGEPIEIVRIPTPELTLDVIRPGDGTYDYFIGYDRWEDGSTTPEVMLTVWPTSYVNYVPTNDLVIVSKFWKPGRAFGDQKEGRRSEGNPGAALSRARNRAGVLRERESGRRRHELHHAATAREREVRGAVWLGEGQGGRAARDALRGTVRRRGGGIRSSPEPVGARRLPRETIDLARARAGSCRSRVRLRRRGRVGGRGRHRERGREVPDRLHPELIHEELAENAQRSR